jgi:hypothetical protein
MQRSQLQMQRLYRNCTFSKISRCTVCRVKTSNINAKRNCSGPPGLGDWIALALDAAGITKQRVKKVIGGCGCQKRQEALNTFGSRVARVFARR